MRGSTHFPIIYGLGKHVNFDMSYIVKYYRLCISGNAICVAICVIQLYTLFGKQNSIFHKYNYVSVENDSLAAL